MGKFYGKIGFGDSIEDDKSVWDDKIIERQYYGDVIKSTDKWNKTENVNDDLTVSNRISIISDSFSLDHIYQMKFVEWRGIPWQIKEANEQYPRIVLTLGGVYNGPRAETTRA